MRKKAFIVILSAVALLGGAPALIGLAFSRYFRIPFDRCLFDYVSKVYSVNVKPIIVQVHFLFFILLCGLIIGCVILWLVGVYQKNVKMKNVCRALLLPACVGLILLLALVSLDYSVFFGCTVDIG